MLSEENSLELVTAIPDDWFDYDWMSPSRFIKNVKVGLENGYPECCVLAFAADCTGFYGVVHSERSNGDGFVPCERHS